MPATTKKPIKIVPNTIKTIPKIAPATIIPKKTLEEQLEEIYDDINIDLDDLPDELLEVYEELEGDYKEKSIQKNWKLWLTMFTPFILPAFIKGVSGQVTLPYDARQSVQSNAPEPKVVVDYAKKYFEEHGLELVKTLSQTDCERLKVQLRDNWGKGPTEFKKSFEEDYANTKARLDSIYRTEYVTAQNEGIIARAKDSKHAWKQWNAALDERTCPVCGDQLHGTIIPIEEEFTAVMESKSGSTEISVNGPPVHPNCRCVLTTLSEEDYDERKENSAYLNDAFDTIKLNYKCKFGTVDDSNKCGIEQDKSINSGKTIDELDDKHLNAISDYTKGLSNQITSLIMNHEINDYEDPIDADPDATPEQNIQNLIDTLDDAIVQSVPLETGIYYHGTDDISKYIEGDEFEYSTFMSITDDLETARQFGDVSGSVFDEDYNATILKVIVPNDIKGITIPPEYSGSDFADMKESILARNTKFVIGKTFVDNNTKITEVTAIPDKQKQNSAYLADAFETIKLNYNCPDSEKIGSGPGSCGGNTDSKINLNPEIAPADYNSFFENFNKISKDKSEPDRIMRRLNAETVQRRFYRKTKEHFNEIKLENDKKLKEKDEKLWDNLRPEVQSAIKSYTTQDYGVINSALQDGITREEVSLLKEATSKPLGVSTILYRGINFKMPKDIFKVGATWIHKPFASCSTGSFIAEEAASGKLTHITPEEKTILQIFTEPETKGFAVGKNSFHAGADAGSEVILDAGTKFQTIHSEKRGGMRILTVRAINDEQKQDSSYLEDVTNFIKLNYKCPKGTVDDSNKCNPEEQEKSNTSDSKSASETFIGFKADHDFSSPQDIETNKRIQASLDKAAEPLKKFKPEDRRILRQYSVNSYVDVNQYLNGTLGKEVDQDSSILRHAKEDVVALDKLFSEANLQEPLVTYRGLKDDIIVKNPELRDALDTPGSEIEFPCFSSTSALPFMANNFAEGYNGRLLELQLPTGTKALFIAEESGLPNEFEILVNRGTKFKVVETRYTNIIPPNNGSYKDRSAKHVKITTIKAIV